MERAKMLRDEQEKDRLKREQEAQQKQEALLRERSRTDIRAPM